jgi:molecular chaperone DnaK
MERFAVDVGIATKGGRFVALLRRGTPVSCRDTQIFTTADDNQTSLKVHVLHGVSEASADNVDLGRYEVALVPAPRGVPVIEVSFDVDAAGLFRLSARYAEGADIPVTGL